MTLARANSFFLHGESRSAVIFVHGFTASPSEVFPTAVLLNQNGGYNISGLLLPGHGTTPESLNNTGWEMWYEAVKSEYQKIRNTYESIFVAGLSMGALLAIYAGIYIPGIKGVISINAPMLNRSPFCTAISPIIEIFSSSVPKKLSSQALKQKESGRFAYEVIPIKAFRSMLKLRNYVITDIKQLSIPFLVFQSLKDESVRKQSAYLLMKKASRAPITYKELPKSDHVATMGKEKEIISSTMIDFIKKHE